MRLTDVSLIFFAALSFASAMKIHESCDPPTTTTTTTTTLTTTAGTTAALSSKGNTTTTTAEPATSSTSQTTTGSGSGKRRRRATGKECKIENAECKENNCTCIANYVPSKDLLECNKLSGAPREHMSKVLVAALFAVLTLIFRPM